MSSVPIIKQLKLLGALLTSKKTVNIIAVSIIAVSLSTSMPVFADTLNYPWPTDTQAPCEFAPNGGASCVNPNNSNDEYDWGVNSGGTFHPYRNGYEYRNCTDYVQWKESTEGVSVPTNWGNGGQWYNNAPSGEESSSPKAWDAAVEPGTVGHVAFVESVNSDGTITVSEYNHLENGTGDTRTAAASSMGFTEFVDFGVHPGGGGGTSTVPKNTPLQYNSEMDVFKRGSDTGIWQDTIQSGSSSWGGWHSLGGGLASNPSADQYGAEMDVFAINPIGQIWQDTYQPSTNSWNNWQWRANNMAGDPTSVVYNGNLYVFSRGTDGNLYVTYWNGSTWVGPNRIAGNGTIAMGSSPTVTVYGSEMDVYIRGTDSNLWKSGTGDGVNFGSLGNMGGGDLENDPKAITYDGEMDIYANTTSGTLVKDTWGGSSWSGFNSLAGVGFIGSPTAMQYNSGEMDVYDRGISDSYIYQDKWEAGGTSWSGWTSMGGNEAGDPTALQWGTEMDVYDTNYSNQTDKDTFNPSTQSWGGFLSLL